MIVTSMQLTISSRRDIAVLQKESSSLEGEEDVKSAGSRIYCKNAMKDCETTICSCENAWGKVAPVSSTTRQPGSRL